MVAAIGNKQAGHAAWQPAGGRVNDGRLQLLHFSTLPKDLVARQEQPQIQPGQLQVLLSNGKSTITSTAVLVATGIDQLPCEYQLSSIACACATNGMV